MLKTLKDLLQNYWANCLETWYVASGTIVLQNLHKTSSWVDLGLIYGKVNFGSIRHLNGKSWNVIFCCFCMEMKWTASHMNARGQGHFRAVYPWTSDRVICILFQKSLLPLWSKYQVSVYRTNGPLGIILITMFTISALQDKSQYHCFLPDYQASIKYWFKKWLLQKKSLIYVTGWDMTVFCFFLNLGYFFRNLFWRKRLLFRKCPGRILTHNASA